jgi:hypothetical protein
MAGLKSKILSRELGRLGGFEARWAAGRLPSVPFEMQFEIEESSVVAATIVEGLLTKIGRRIPELESDASPGLFHLPWLSFHLGLRWGA